MTKERLHLMITIAVILVTFYLIVHFIYYLIEKSARASFKKLYTTYTQALDMTVRDFDGEIACYFSGSKDVESDFSGCDKFYKKFSTNLKVRKYCKDNSLKNDCLPKYKKYAVKPSCAGFSESMMDRYNQTFVMRDGSTLTVFNQPANEQKPAFAVDSNGKTYPNKAGYDLFSLVIIRNEHGNYKFHPNITYCLPEEKGGVRILQDVYK